MLTHSQIIPASYQNEAKLIEIRDLNPDMIPGSPEDIRLPVPPSGMTSGMISPLSGMGTPALSLDAPSEQANPLLVPMKPIRVVKEEHPLSKD